MGAWEPYFPTRLLRFTSLDKHFFALDFFTLLPKARDLKAWKAARFSLDPDCLTCWSPSLISSASAFKAFVSFSSRGVLTNPSSSKIFLVLGLCITVLNICFFSWCDRKFMSHFVSSAFFWGSVLKSRWFVCCQEIALFCLFTVSSHSFSYFFVFLLRLHVSVLWSLLLCFLSGLSLWWMSHVFADRSQILGFVFAFL